MQWDAVSGVRRMEQNAGSSTECMDGRDWGQEEKGRIEDEMAGWHH